MRSHLGLAVLLAILLLAPLSGLSAAFDADEETKTQSSTSVQHGSLIDELSSAQSEALAAARTSGRATSQNWLHHVGGIGGDEGVIIRLGPSGSLFVGGNICHGAGTCSAIFGNTTIYANNDIFVAKLDRNGSWQWIAQTTGTGSNPYAYMQDMEIDQYGNVFLVGYFRYTKSFGTTSLTPRSYASSYDGFAASISSAGAWSWAVKMGGSNQDYARGLALDSNQDLYVVGENYLYYGSSTYRSAYFGGYSYQTSCSTSNYWRWDGFLTKISSSGSFQYVTHIQASCNNAYLDDVVIDSNSKVIVTGRFDNTVSAGGRSTTSAGNYDVFLGKASSSSSWDWIIQGGGLSSDEPNKLAVDSNDDIYVVGYNSNHASYGTTIILANSGGFVVKALANGTWEWGTRLSPSYNVKDIALHSNGNISVIGDRYLHHLNSTGAQQWYLSTSQSIMSLDIDSNGTAYIAGYFSGSKWFENFYLTSNGSNDLVIWRWDRDRDSDSVADRLDNCPDRYNGNQDDYDSDGEGDACDADDDDDGFPDVVDNCPTGDMNWLSNQTTDRDQDGCQDSGEDSDDDDDGIADTTDACPLGSLNWSSHGGTDHDSDGCHDDQEDSDDDNDGISDVRDACSKGALNWNSTAITDYDSDGCNDLTEDSDDDNDSRSDGSDDCAKGDLNWTSNESTDWDYDGCRDAGEDNDDDSDGALDADDLCMRGVRYWTRYFSADYDDDGCRDSDEDGDDDNDGVPDHNDICQLGQLNWTSNASTDNDADGCRDSDEDGDDDNDGISDVNDFCPQGDIGWISGRVTDHDGDGCNDNAEDTDDDGDGIPDHLDKCPLGMIGWTSNGGSDNDGDGCLDSTEDGDDDDDGVPDRLDPCPYNVEFDCVPQTQGNVTVIHQYPENGSAANQTAPPTSTVIQYHNNSTTVIHYYNNTTNVEPPRVDQPNAANQTPTETPDPVVVDPAEEDTTLSGGFSGTALTGMVSMFALLFISIVVILLVMLQFGSRRDRGLKLDESVEFESDFDTDIDDQYVQDMHPEPDLGLQHEPFPAETHEEMIPLEEPQVGAEGEEMGVEEATLQQYAKQFDPAPQPAEFHDPALPPANVVGTIGEDGLEWYEHPAGSGAFWYRENQTSDWQAWQN